MSFAGLDVYKRQVLVASNAFAQQIKGVVTDSVTHEPLMYISVYYQEKDVYKRQV